MDRDLSKSSRQRRESSREEIREACARLELGWSTGYRPEIAGILGQLSAEAQREGFLQLLLKELQCRNKAGELPTLAEYLSRFPAHAQEVETAFSQLTHPDVHKVAESHGGSVDSTVDQPGSLRVCCPHCDHVLRTAAVDLQADITCPSCGGTISFAAEATLDWQAGQATAHRRPTTIGHFELVEQLGAGAFGTVWKAHDKTLDRTVAVKIPRKQQLTRDETEKFLREARAAAQLQHANIVAVYEVGLEGNTVYIASEYIEGMSLADWLEGNKSSRREAAELCAQIADALDCAHQRGVVHRDLKPGNVMIDTAGRPHVMDFGLAKREAGEVTMTFEGQILGTPAYMSPEQAKGGAHAADRRSDIYSLGVVLYELLTGERPFRGNVRMLLKQVIEDEPPSPRKLDGTVPRDLETVCLKCLEKEPERRYSSAAELADDLRRWLAGQPVQARPVGRVEQWWRWTKRNPRVAGLTAAVVGLVLAGVVGAVAAVVRIAVAQRDAARADAVAAITQSFEIGLDADHWDEEHLAKLEATVADLQRLDPEKGEAADERLQQRFAQFIDSEITQPRLRPEDFDRIESMLAALAKRRPRLEAQLRARLQRRLAFWEPLFELADPFAGIEDVFEPPRVRAENGSLVCSTSGEEPTVVSTRVASAGTVQMEALFAPSWLSVSEVGIVLNHGPEDTCHSGYEVIVHPGSSEDLSAHELEILRDGVRLRRRAIPFAEIPQGPLRLVATREGRRLAVQVNQLPPLVVEDMFPLPPDRPGVFALLWPKDVHLVRLQAQHQTAPPEASPLELGDAAYAESRFDDALKQYDVQAKASSDAEIVQEARFKAGLCLLAIGRQDDAVAAFEDLSDEQGERWPTLAACRLWLHYLQQGRLAEADAVFATLASRFRFEELAVLLPEDLRAQIVEGYLDQFKAMGSLIRFNPQLVRELERAVAVEDLLEMPQPQTREFLVRAYRMAGEFDKAIPLAESVVRIDATVHWYVEEYCWLLRLHRKPQEALEEMDRALFEEPGVFRKGMIPLLVDRAKIHWQMENWHRAEEDLRNLLSRLGPEDLDFNHYSDAILMLGYLQERRGDSLGALKTWREGMEIAEEVMRSTGQSHGTLLRTAILASLTDTLSDDLGELLVTKAFADASEDSPAVVLINALASSQRERLGSILREMWRTPRGEQDARRIAFEEIELVDRYRLPILLAWVQVIHQFAFQRDPSSDQQQLARELAEAFYSATLERGDLGRQVLLQLAAAWQGVAGVVGWAALERSLAERPEILGPLAYVMGHRYLRLEKQADGTRCLQLARSLATEESVLARLAQTDLDLLAAGRGRVMITCDYPEAVRLAAKRDDGSTATLDVTRNRTLDMTEGSYELALVKPPPDVSLSPARFEVRTGGRHRVHVDWFWTPGPEDHALPGIVPRPAKLPGIHQWQVETAVPRGAISHIDWSPDGKWLACGTTCGLIRVCHGNNGELAVIMFGHTGPVSSLAWSLDGRWIVSASIDKTVRWWTPVGQQGPCRTLNCPLTCLARSPNGKWMAAAGGRRIHLFEESGKPGPILPLSSDPTAIAWSPDSERIAFGASDRTIRLLDFDGSVETIVEQSPRWNFDLAWTSNGRWLAFAQSEAWLQLLRPDGQRGPTLEGHATSVKRVAWAPDGQCLASAADDNTVRLWATNGKPGPTLKSPSACSIAWSPDGRLVASGSWDGSLRIWQRDGKPVTKLEGRAAIPRSVCSPKDSSAVVSFWSDGFVRQWRSDGSPGFSTKLQTDGESPLAWSQDGQRLAAGCGKMLRIWHLDELSEPAAELRTDVTALAWSPSAGVLCFAGSAPPAITMWAPDGGPTRELMGQVARVRSLAWHPDGQVLACGGSDGTIRFCQADGGAGPVLEAHKWGVKALDWNPSGQSLASGGGDGIVRLWSSRGDAKATLRGHYFVHQVCWAAAGDLLASCGRDPVIRLWQDDGTLVGELALPFGGAEALAWSADGKHLFCGCTNGSLSLWNLRTREIEWTVLPLGGMRSAAFGRGGNILDEDVQSLDDHLVYQIVTPTGAMELLTSSEFRDRIDKAIPVETER